MYRNLFPVQHPQELTVQNNQAFIYSDEQLMARLKFFIGVCLALTLTGIVFVVLYSIIFVTQPLNAISPIDQKFFELIIPIATFLTGTLSGIMLAGGSKEEMDAKLSLMKQAGENQVQSAKSTLASQQLSEQRSTKSSTSGVYVNKVEPTLDQPGQIIIGFGGKPAPAPAAQPEL